LSLFLVFLLSYVLLSCIFVFFNGFLFGLIIIGNYDCYFVFFCFLFRFHICSSVLHNFLDSDPIYLNYWDYILMFLFFPHLFSVMPTLCHTNFAKHSLICINSSATLHMCDAAVYSHDFFNAVIFLPFLLETTSSILFSCTFYCSMNNKLSVVHLCEKKSKLHFLYGPQLNQD
jgi:hypothetical protein